MKTMTPIRAIRAYCLECSGGSREEVRFCAITGCALHPYRFGTNPARAGNGRISNVGGRKKQHLQAPDADALPREIAGKTPTQRRESGQGIESNTPSEGGREGQ